MLKDKNGSTKDVEIMVLLKYVNNFSRALEVPLITCEISLQLKWSEDCLLGSWYCSKSRTKT